MVLGRGSHDAFATAMDWTGRKWPRLGWKEFTHMHNGSFDQGKKKERKIAKLVPECVRRL